MQTKTKLLIAITLMLLGLTTATIINVSINLKEYSIEGALKKSQMTAKIVEDGLTAHMVNGIMPQRAYFLDKISSHDDIKSLWIVRGDNVIKQYGDGFKNEFVRDNLDKQVIESGKKLNRLGDNNILRVTIPYIATANGGDKSCLACHDVSLGDTLGAISMEFDITDTKESSIMVILKILAINILFIFIVLGLVSYVIAPYIKLVTNLEDGIAKASKGDFTHEFHTIIGGNAKIIINQMNTLFHKMHDTFGEIKLTLSTFTPPQGGSKTDDPLYEAKSIINELSDIYRFKKTIELDSTKEVVFGRFVDILKLKYKLKDFALYEILNIREERFLIHATSEDAIICDDDIDAKAGRCRAYRTKTDIISTDFVDLCKHCDAKDKSYICIPFSINDDSSMLLSIVAPSKNEINRINSLVHSIKNYLEAAKPVIESRILMDQLRDTSLRDAMTGLYNRRFLEEFIDKVMSQVQREKETYTVMMLDVDFFKMVNDTYGHDIGDKVIVEIGKLLKEGIRESDLAIRYGGEEFIIMLHNANEEGAAKIAKEIHKAFGELIFDVGNGETMQKTMSIGVATFPTDGDSIWKCIKFADTALYEAKTTGRNKIVNFRAEMFENESEF